MSRDRLRGIIAAETDIANRAFARGSDSVRDLGVTVRRAANLAYCAGQSSMSPRSLAEMLGIEVTVRQHDLANGRGRVFNNHAERVFDQLGLPDALYEAISLLPVSMIPDTIDIELPTWLAFHTAAIAPDCKDWAVEGLWTELVRRRSEDGLEFPEVLPRATLGILSAIVCTARDMAELYFETSQTPGIFAHLQRATEAIQP